MEPLLLLLVFTPHPPVPRILVGQREKVRFGFFRLFLIGAEVVTFSLFWVGKTDPKPNPERVGF